MRNKRLRILFVQQILGQDQQQNEHYLEITILELFTTEALSFTNNFNEIAKYFHIWLNG